MTSPPDSPGRTARPVEPCWCLSLTDEELVALHEDRRGIVMLPHVATLAAEHRAVAVETAKRGLVVRGLLPATESAWGCRPVQPIDREHWEPTDAPDGVLADLFLLRDNAEAVLAVQRTTAAGPPLLRYLHLVVDVVLVEDVSAHGIHLFGVLDRADLPGLLHAFLVPTDAVDGVAAIHLGDPGTGPVEVAPPDPGLEILARATVTADAILRWVGDGVDADHPPELTGFFLGPAGCHQVRARVGAPGPMLAEPIRAAEVGRLVTELLVRGGPPGEELADARLCG